MATFPNTLMQALTVFAWVTAVAGLVLAAFFVHERRQRISALLLSAGVICLLVGPMLSSSLASLAITAIAVVLVTASAAISFRILRARPD